MNPDIPPEIIQDHTPVGPPSKRAGRFRKGASGNPKGRPPGSRNRVTLAVEAILDGEAERLTRKAVEMALAGNMAALRLCIERLAPVGHERPISAQIPELTSAIGTAAKLRLVFA